MAIVLGSSTWSPSTFQAGVPIDSNNPGDSSLQRVADALNRSWLDCDNYVFVFPGGSAFGDLTVNPSLTVTAFSWRAHNPTGLVNLRFTVEGRYTGGTGAVVRLKQGGVTIATRTLSTTYAAATAFGTVTAGTQAYTIEVQTQAGSTADVRNIWLSWGDFI
jgi:hypothetical protein